jgi:hypothetical protein
MSNLAYLFIAFVLSGVGLTVLWLRSRPSPASPRSSVEQFNDKMRALAPMDDRRDPADRERRGA